MYKVLKTNQKIELVRYKREFVITEFDCTCIRKYFDENNGTLKILRFLAYLITIVFQNKHNIFSFLIDLGIWQHLKIFSHKTQKNTFLIGPKLGNK